MLNMPPISGAPAPAPNAGAGACAWEIIKWIGASNEVENKEQLASSGRVTE